MKISVSMFLLAVLLLLSLPATANDVKEHPKLPLEKALPLLEPISSDAIRMGNGSVKVHVFIDPNCPRSREFVTLISENEKMRSRYSYYFYFYELKRFKSRALIKTIYRAKNPLQAMLDVMVNKQELKAPSLPDKQVSDKIARIAKTARALDVYKRPYLIMIKKPRKRK
jgi:hypothetical protein